MAIVNALTRLKHEPFGDLPLAQSLDQALRQCAHVWRERLLPPLVTLRLFVLQVLHGNVSITHLRQLTGIDFAPASYCGARVRLPLAAITSLLSALVQLAQKATTSAATIGQRILIIDGSNFSMSDEPELRTHFGLPQGTKPGVGFPLAKILGVMDAATGMFVQMLCLPLFTHEMSAVAQVHPDLQIGDILLGDRAFCSFVHMALLQARGVFACFRLHQIRKDQGGQGLRRWKRPQESPKWMSKDQFLSLPLWLDVRLVSYSLIQKGFRTRHVTIATTLLDETLWPDQRVAELYAKRWQIEEYQPHYTSSVCFYRVAG